MEEVSPMILHKALLKKTIDVGLKLIDLIQKLLHCFLSPLKTPLLMLCSFSVFHTYTPGESTSITQGSSTALP